jgi:hypothetical protein
MSDLVDATIINTSGNLVEISSPKNSSGSGKDVEGPTI